MYIDTHAHLNHRQFAADLEAVIVRAKEAGVTQIINVGYDLKSSIEAARLAECSDGFWAACGVHPHDATECGAGTLEELRRLAQEPRLVAIGETGLDFYRNLSPRDVQAETFRALIALALELRLPLIIHVREAHEEALRILVEAGAGAVGGVFHCFSGDWQFARWCLDAGFHLGLDGPVTYPKSDALREVARRAPLDRLLLETDCPYLPPQSRRGERNEPSLLPEIARCVTQLRGLAIEELAAATTANAARLFRLRGEDARERPAREEEPGRTLSL